MLTSFNIDTCVQYILLLSLLCMQFQASDKRFALELPLSLVMQHYFYAICIKIRQISK